METDKVMLENLQRAVSLNPRFFEGYFAIGNIFRKNNAFDKALSNYLKSINIKPDFEAAYLGAGQVLSLLGKLDDAINTYQNALTKLPNACAIHLNLAIVFLQSNNFSSAIISFERALKLDVRCADALINIGQTLLDKGKVDESIRLVRLAPKSTRSLMFLGDALNRLGKVTDAMNCWRDTVDIDPNFVTPHQFLLRHSHYLENYSREQIYTDHVAFGERLEASWRAQRPKQVKPANPQKRLRVGFVSYDLIAGHPVGCFLESVLHELHRLDRIDIIVYSANAAVDAVTDRIRAASHLWSPVFDLSDDACEKRIRDDAIDILVDLSGHTNGNRLAVFARKPAPIQVTWLGYWNTTGLHAMDYILCDPFCVNDDETNLFIEKPWYLPDTRLCFSPPNEIMVVAPLPALNNGYVTFGCFNNLNKITDRVVSVWSRILQRVPNARLLLKWKSFYVVGVREEMMARFAAEGISADRLEFQAASPLGEYFSTYDNVDIALDPFPFTGGATSAQGIWMGVPMITLRGDSMISRQGESMLHNIGLPDWIAQSEDDYVELAVKKSTDLKMLSHLRGQLRSKLEASPLSDAKSLAKNLEMAFRQMWEIFLRIN